MPHRIRRITPDDLTEPRAMEPAAFLHIPLTTLAQPIHHQHDSDALYLATDAVQFALVSFPEQPDETHLYIADSAHLYRKQPAKASIPSTIGRHTSTLMET